jgi:hypothetical protein
MQAVGEDIAAGRDLLVEEGAPTEDAHDTQAG